MPHDRPANNWNGPKDGRYDRRILNAFRQFIPAADIDSRKLAAEHRITAPQLLSLMAIVELGRATAIDVSRLVHLGPSTLVGVMDRLHAKRLIKRDRDRDDRRRISIVATAAGKALIAKTPFPLQFSLERALRQMAEKERRHVADNMERLVELMAVQDIDTRPMLEILAIEQDHEDEHA